MEQLAIISKWIDNSIMKKVSKPIISKRKKWYKFASIISYLNNEQ